MTQTYEKDDIIERTVSQWHSVCVHTNTLSEDHCSCRVCCITVCRTVLLMSSISEVCGVGVLTTQHCYSTPCCQNDYDYETVNGNSSSDTYTYKHFRLYHRSCVCPRVLNPQPPFFYTSPTVKSPSSSLTVTVIGASRPEAYPPHFCSRAYMCFTDCINILPCLRPASSLNTTRP